MASEKMFNSYPLKNDINKNDVGMVWDSSLSQVNNFTMETLAEYISSTIKNKIDIDENGILHF